MQSGQIWPAEVSRVGSGKGPSIVLATEYASDQKRDLLLSMMGDECLPFPQQRARQGGRRR